MGFLKRQVKKTCFCHQLEVVELFYSYGSRSISYLKYVLVFLFTLWLKMLKIIKNTAVQLFDIIFYYRCIKFYMPKGLYWVLRFYSTYVFGLRILWIWLYVYFIYVCMFEKNGSYNSGLVSGAWIEIALKRLLVLVFAFCQQYI